MIIFSCLNAEFFVKAVRQWLKRNRAVTDATIILLP